MPTVQLMTTTQTQAAWAWLLANLPTRAPIGPLVSYDDLSAWQDALGRLLHPSPAVLENVAALYTISTFADERALKSLINGVAAPIVAVHTPLDQTLRTLYASEPRFRNSLAEHLGFWMPVAIRKRATPAATIVGSKPHVLPEDTGPDGIVLDCGSMAGELISIKSSLKSPRQMIASSGFRKTGKAAKGSPPQFDEFYLYEKRNHGFTKVTDLALKVAYAAQLTMTEQTKSALLSNFAYHAFVVASHEFADATLFEGYQRIANSPSRRLATFLGANNWKSFAKNTRAKFKRLLATAGISVRP